MDYSKFSYPNNYETPLLQAYDSRFSAAFIALHPFFRMPISVEWELIDSSTDYPDSPFVRQYGQPVYWQTIMQGIGCEVLRRFYIGMRTSIAALTRENEEEMAKLINEYTEQAGVQQPSEGMIEPLLVEPISQYISRAQRNEILYLAEFEEEPERLSAEAIIQKSDDPPYLRGSLFDATVTRLATVDWDDFFTVIYGSSDELAALLENTPLEGFFCDDQTTLLWCRQDKPVKPSA